MSDVDVAVVQVAGAIAVTLIGAYVAHKLQERSADIALAKEVMLRPYGDRMTALKAVYISLTVCANKMYENVNRFPKTREQYLEGVIAPLDNFKETLSRNGIWLEKVESKLIDSLGVFIRTVLALQIRVDESVSLVLNQSRPSDLSTVPIPWEELLRIPALTSKAIGDELGVHALEQQLERLTAALGGGSPPTSGSSIMSQNPDREIDLLKINLAADYRLGWLVAMTGVYFALIVGLLVAWYQKFGSNIDAFYFIGLFLIIGVFGALLVTQELIPYKNWFKLMDEWLTMIEG